MMFVDAGQLVLEDDQVLAYVAVLVGVTLCIVAGVDLQAVLTDCRQTNWHQHLYQCYTRRHRWRSKVSTPREQDIELLSKLLLDWTNSLPAVFFCRVYPPYCPTPVRPTCCELIFFDVGMGGPREAGKDRHDSYKIFTKYNFVEPTQIINHHMYSEINEKRIHMATKHLVRRQQVKSQTSTELRRARRVRMARKRQRHGGHAESDVGNN